jgi:hypothetical protein
LSSPSSPSPPPLLCDVRISEKTAAEKLDLSRGAFKIIDKSISDKT